MSSAAVALPPASPAKSPKRRSKSLKKKTGPTVSDLILKALSASKERGGVSLVALKKALQAGGYDVAKNKARIIIAIRRLVANKALLQTKGTGASGSFKLNKKPPAPRKKKVVVKKKEPRAKKVKRASPKKAAGGAAPAAKKSPKKRRKAKSPKKAKRPAAAKKPKSPRKAKSPKKATRRVAKSTRTRAAAKK
ncbi:protamine-like protein [Centroberyx affinis]|uniref:protamine-like protein n=1 Tax=Centroberyx affinis TaxID=166261 RepID=UPI003A5B96F4